LKKLSNEGTSERKLNVSGESLKKNRKRQREIRGACVIRDCE